MEKINNKLKEIKKNKKNKISMVLNLIIYISSILLIINLIFYLGIIVGASK